MPMSNAAAVANLPVGLAFHSYVSEQGVSGTIEKEELRQYFKGFELDRRHTLTKWTGYGTCLYTLKLHKKIRVYTAVDGNVYVILSGSGPQPAPRRARRNPNTGAGTTGGDGSPRGSYETTSGGNRYGGSRGAGRPAGTQSLQYTVCQICPQTLFVSIAEAKRAKHEESAEHLDRLRQMVVGSAELDKCVLCGNIGIQGQYQSHLNSECLMILVTKSMAAGMAGSLHYICGICNVGFLSEEAKTEHVGGIHHQTQKLIIDYRLLGNQVKIDKGGIRVAAALETGPEGQPVPVEATKDNKFILRALTKPSIAGLQFIIRNHNKGSVLLEACGFISPFPGAKLLSWKDQDLRNALPAKLEKMSDGPECKFIVKCRFRVTQSMRSTIPLQFTFTKKNRNGFSETIQIVKEITLTTANEVDEVLLQPTAPYKRPELKIRKEMSHRNTDYGERPPSFKNKNKLERVLELKEYRIPSVFHEYLYSPPHARESSMEDISSAYDLFETLGEDNYSSKLHALLYLEEVQMEHDMERYEMTSTMQVDRHSGLFTLEVPGLSEKRPSLLKGDKVYAIASDDLGTKFESYIHRVELDKIQLGFSRNFRMKYERVVNTRFDFSFTVHRLPMKVMHRAVDLAIPRSSKERSLADALFPSDVPRALTRLTAPLRFNNRDIEGNPEQKQAVENIVCRTSGSAPFLIFGPPGTGKTVTLVEALKQVHQKDSRSMILACAPQNAAADLIASRLIEHIDKQKILRLNAQSRNRNDVNASFPDIMPVCNFEGEDVYFPTKTDLMKIRIIVCTPVTASRLVTGGFPTDHFTHIFMDEAGHAMEPEAMAAFAGLHSETCQIVLAGDPKQLGAVIRCSEAISNGLEMSLLQRLMDTNEVYKPRDGSADASMASYDSRVLVKLVKNYRSNKHILTIPNHLFYRGQLQACADKDAMNEFCWWDVLPRKGFPVIFHGLTGEDKREENSPSFFNPDEVICVGDYVEKYVELKKGKLRPLDIGIISPYQKQVQKLRKYLRVLERRNPTVPYSDIRVGSVEEFQGQERKVIIISTVRSPNDHYLKLDKEFNLGFLRNPKRFNVAITRAKSLLIVIGNPHVLRKDKFWRAFITYCHNGKLSNGDPQWTSGSGCVGVLPDWIGQQTEEDEDEEEMDLLKQLARLDLNGKLKPVDDDDDDETVKVDDPPWVRRE